MRETKEYRALPTGWRLKSEMVRLKLKSAAVARALKEPVQRVMRVLLVDEVLPPGWLKRLRELGVVVEEPMWNASMPGYSGQTWAREGTCMPESRWAQLLGVDAREVRGVMGQRAAVPQSWLLKLAEQGMEVPTEVYTTLLRYRLHREAPDEGAVPTRTKPRRGVRAVRRKSTPVADSVSKARLSFQVQWNDEQGLSIHLSEALRQQLPVEFGNLLARLGVEGQ